MAKEIYGEFIFFKNYLKQLLEKDNNLKTTITFTAKHHALAYIFDLMVKGQHIPMSDGGLNQKLLLEIGKSRTGKKSGSGFVKSIREIRRNYDINREGDLRHISENWKKIVLELSN